MIVSGGCDSIAQIYLEDLKIWSGSDLLRHDDAGEVKGPMKHKAKCRTGRKRKRRNISNCQNLEFGLNQNRNLSLEWIPYRARSKIISDSFQTIYSVCVRSSAVITLISWVLSLLENFHTFLVVDLIVSNPPWFKESKYAHRVVLVPMTRDNFLLRSI